MYLSLLALNHQNRQVQQELAFAYELHRTVLSGFRGHADLPSQRVLYRLEGEGRGTPLRLLVQSRDQPDWREASEKRDAAGQPYLVAPPQGRAMDWLPRVSVGHRFSFRLRANPTKRKALPRAGQDDRKDGPRLPLLRDEEQLAWLHRHAETGGFRLLHVAISGKANDHDARRHLTLFTVRFDGALEVVDADRFRACLQAGVGSAKGFGCGLLSLAPLSTVATAASGGRAP